MLTAGMGAERDEMIRHFFLLGIAGLVLSLPVGAAPCTIRYFQQDARYAYRTALLQLVLDKTQEQGECSLSPQFTTVTPDRGLVLLQEGRIDVVSVPTTLGALALAPAGPWHWPSPSALFLPSSSP